MFGSKSSTESKIREGNGRGGKGKKGLNPRLESQILGTAKEMMVIW